MSMSILRDQMSLMVLGDTPQRYMYIYIYIYIHISIYLSIYICIHIYI